MNRIGFDNNQYVRLQSERIRERIGKFGGKLYLEFGGKLFDDYHASRVLPGFQPDSKIRMLLEMKEEAEVIVAISAQDIERNKRRGDLGITYDMEALRLIDAFRASGLLVGGVCITHCKGEEDRKLACFIHLLSRCAYCVLGFQVLECILSHGAVIAAKGDRI